MGHEDVEQLRCCVCCLGLCTPPPIPTLGSLTDDDSLEALEIYNSASFTLIYYAAVWVLLILIVLERPHMYTSRTSVILSTAGATADPCGSVHVSLPGSLGARPPPRTPPAEHRGLRDTALRPGGQR